MWKTWWKVEILFLRFAGGNEMIQIYDDYDVNDYVDQSSYLG